MAQQVKPVTMIADAALGQAIGKLALFPPALTRLEPQSAPCRGSPTRCG